MSRSYSPTSFSRLLLSNEAAASTFHACTQSLVVTAAITFHSRFGESQIQEGLPWVTPLRSACYLLESPHWHGLWGLPGPPLLSLSLSLPTVAHPPCSTPRWHELLTAWWPWGTRMDYMVPDPTPERHSMSPYWSTNHEGRPHPRGREP